MRRLVASLVILFGSSSGTVRTVSAWAAEPPGPESATILSDAGFVNLIADERCAAWDVQDGSREAWMLASGVLRCAGRNGWLRTRQAYSDFVLRFEFRTFQEGEVAVTLRYLPGLASNRRGVEIDLRAGPTAAQLGQAAVVPVEGAAPGSSWRELLKPAGEWNLCELTCRGTKLDTILNSKPVERSTGGIQVGAADASANRQAKRPQLGLVGFRVSQTAAEFREISIKDLSMTTASGVNYVDLVEGTGEVVAADATIVATFSTWLIDGTVVDGLPKGDEPTAVALRDSIAGWAEGVVGMKVGGRRQLVVPPALGYGDHGAPPAIPPQATLVFDIEVLDIR